VNLVDGWIEVFQARSPESGVAEYERMTKYAAEEQVGVRIDGAVLGMIAVAELLP